MCSDISEKDGQELQQGWKNLFAAGCVRPCLNFDHRECLSVAAVCNAAENLAWWGRAAAPMRAL
jgi:hypothetical protein